MTSTGTNSICLYQSGGSYLRFDNNIIMNSGGGYSYYINTPNAIISSDYNDLYTTGLTLAYWLGAKPNLAALQLGSGKDVHSVSIDPDFYSATDLHCLSTAMNGLGLPNPLVDDDIDSQIRDTITPDIGADGLHLLT